LVRPGTLYRAISRLVDAELIAELDEAPGIGATTAIFSTAGW
jgi:hypothetical protein